MAHWLLQANPSRWRVLDFFADDPDGRTLDGWRVTRYFGEVHPGDDLALWMSGPDAGVIALGEVTGPVSEAQGPVDMYWTDPSEVDGARWALPLRIMEVFIDAPVRRHELRDDSRFGAAAILRQPFAGNPFRLSDQEWAAILELRGHRTTIWTLQPGALLSRKELHDRYGGSRQDGISPSRTTPNVFIFTDPASEHQHGYYDEWAPNDTFLYTARGQYGDQSFTFGNRAIRDHQPDGRALRVFQGARGLVQYVGQFVLDEDEPFVWARAPSTDNGPLRRVIRFRLRPIERASAQPDASRGTIGLAYQHQDERIEPATRDQRGPADPDAHGRGLRAHRRLQNQLSDLVQTAGHQPRRPDALGPDYDLAWETPQKLFVLEVKSCTASNEVSQLRMGIGQVLDYTDTMLARGIPVQAVLHVEHEPADKRWLNLTSRHNIILTWPGREQILFESSG